MKLPFIIQAVGAYKIGVVMTKIKTIAKCRAKYFH